jgi:hypothetical protein
MTEKPKYNKKPWYKKPGAVPPAEKVTDKSGHHSTITVNGKDKKIAKTSEYLLHMMTIEE